MLLLNLSENDGQQKDHFNASMKQFLIPSASISESSTDVLDVTVNEQVEERVK